MASEPGRGPRVGAVVLAAGASSRWGALGPKALAAIEGRSALAHVARSARIAGCAPVVAVVAPGAREWPSEAREEPDRFVVNPDPEEGRTGSLRLGLAELPEGSGAMVWPVDVPFVRPETVSDLVRHTGRESLAVWLTPTYEGRGGHPVGLTAAGVALARHLPASVPLRDAPFRRGLGERRIAVDDPGVIDNTNYFHEFAAAGRAWRAREGLA